MSVHKKVMTEFLHLYRENRCLWDTSDASYANKEVRRNAYEALLDKYIRVQEDATILDVKRRIENVRCSYRREHKKVLMSRLNGEDEYTPHLWYYNLMTFLDEVMCDFSLESSSRQIKQETIEEQRPQKKRRVSNDVNEIYFSEHEDDDDDFTSHKDNNISVEDNENIENIYENENHSLGSKHVTEPEAFGTTVGLQLKELDEMQRVVAEKLISDVIFHARLKKLTISSKLVVSDNDNTCYYR